MIYTKNIVSSDNVWRVFTFVVDVFLCQLYVLLFDIVH
jgi:hypothetical protein